MIIDSPLNCSDNISLWKGNDKMTCSSCQFLNETRKKDGAVSGAIYFCAKKINTSMEMTINVKAMKKLIQEIV